MKNANQARTETVPDLFIGQDRFIYCLTIFNVILKSLAV